MINISSNRENSHIFYYRNSLSLFLKKMDTYKEYILVETLLHKDNKDLSQANFDNIKYFVKKKSKGNRIKFSPVANTEFV